MAPPAAASTGSLSVLTALTASVSNDRSSPSISSTSSGMTSPHRSVTILEPPTTPSLLKGKGRALSTELEVVKWEGSTVFIQDRRLLPASRKTPDRTKAIASQGGSSTSPISVSSSSPSPSRSPNSKHVRPRAIAAYTGPLPRTAFTPPRALAYSTSPSHASHQAVPAIGTFEFRTSPSPSPVSAIRKAPAPSRKVVEAKSIHPFFTSSRKAPTMNAPRYVATYSSTSNSQSQSQSQSQSTPSQSTHESQKSLPAGVEEAVEVEEVIEEEASPEALNEILGVFQNLDLNKPKPSSSKPPAASTKVPAPDLPPTRWTDLPPLPLFSHRRYPNPPKFAFTSSATEANDLLACLTGPVLGFDLEWPMTGVHKVRDRDGKIKKERHGMTWDGAKGGWSFGQAKTALVQVCDEKMIVLIQLTGMKELPSKLVQMLQDPGVFLAGVQTNGDGLKLSRDFPSHFQSTGITSLLELSRLARRVDPEGTRGQKSPLISLANLTKGYLAHELDKDPHVRNGNWSTGLTFKQLEYASNDVYASLQLYLHFKQLADEQSITLDLKSYSSQIIAHNATLKSAAADSSATLPSAFGLTAKAKNGAGPAAFRALQQFQEGRSIPQIAEAGGIKPTTVQSYIYKAVEALPPDHLTAEERVRLEKEIPMEAYWGGPLRKLFRRKASKASEGSHAPGPPAAGEIVSENDVAL